MNSTNPYKQPGESNPYKTGESTRRADHDLANCHDVRHNGLDCPDCDGVKIACRTHTTPAATASSPDAAAGPRPADEPFPPTRRPVTPSDADGDQADAAMGTAPSPGYLEEVVIIQRELVDLTSVDPDKRRLALRTIQQAVHMLDLIEAAGDMGARLTRSSNGNLTTRYRAEAGLTECTGQGPA